MDLNWSYPLISTWSNFNFRIGNELGTRFNYIYYSNQRGLLDCNQKRLIEQLTPYEKKVRNEN